MSVSQISLLQWNNPGDEQNAEKPGLSEMGWW